MHVKGSTTSEAAEAALRPRVGTLSDRVRAHLLAAGPNGSTDEETAKALAMRPTTCRPRRIELCDAGAVWDSGRRRRNTSGREAVVWVHRDHRDQAATRRHTRGRPAMARSIEANDRAAAAIAAAEALENGALIHHLHALATEIVATDTTGRAEVNDLLVFLKANSRSLGKAAHLMRDTP